jgi:hypothetical protein
MASAAESTHGRAANRDTRWRFEQWARNPEFEAKTTSAVLGVSMVEVARRRANRSSRFSVASVSNVGCFVTTQSSSDESSRALACFQPGLDASPIIACATL